MGVIYLHDKSRIEAFLRKDVYLHIYSIGDLDDFFWPDTTWYGWENEGKIQAVALLYTASENPTLLALSEKQNVMWDLVQSIFPVLPERFYAHLSPAVAEATELQCKIKSYGKYYKMGLKNKLLLHDIDCSRVVCLTEDDLDDMFGLYKEGYRQGPKTRKAHLGPQHWFDARTLQTGQYFGLRLKNRLVSVAGIHVYSEKYKVAALGNIVTHPDYRGKGFGTAVTARLCQSLAEHVDNIGLNVKANNTAAIAMYRKLGFEIVGVYFELMVLSHS
ncbi:MAG: GNAT family N-acetyltransferase [Sedimentisphaerales bacterium]|nr:GNAT family N-acetyltransferase [Sedimentisphaerales bacterium]